MFEYSWFVLKVRKRNEDNVKNFIEIHKVSCGLDKDIKNVLIVEEKSVEIVNGKKKEKIVNKYPGYMFLELKTDFDNQKLCELLCKNGNIFGDIRNYNYVIPLDFNDRLKLFSSTEGDIIDNTDDGKIKIGDEVVVTSGTFKNSTGKVFAINEKSNTLTINAKVFLGEYTKIYCPLSVVKKKCL